MFMTVNPLYHKPSFLRQEAGEFTVSLHFRGQRVSEKRRLVV